MIIEAAIWDKTSSVNGKDAAFLSSHFKKDNGNDDRVLIYYDGVVSRIEYLTDSFFTSGDRLYMNGLISGGMDKEQAIAETYAEKARQEYAKGIEKAAQASDIEQMQADILYLSIMTGVEL